MNASTFQSWMPRNARTQTAPGQHQVRMEFKYDGGGLAKGGTVSLFVDGTKSGEGRLEQTERFAFTEESLDVGHEAGSPGFGEGQDGVDNQLR
jgi:hypothetical protein